jgi:hypothetical protein
MRSCTASSDYSATNRRGSVPQHPASKQKRQRKTGAAQRRPQRRKSPMREAEGEAPAYGQKRVHYREESEQRSQAGASATGVGSPIRRSSDHSAREYRSPKDSPRDSQNPSSDDAKATSRSDPRASDGSAHHPHPEGAALFGSRNSSASRQCGREEERGEEQRGSLPRPDDDGRNKQRRERAT